MVGVLVLRSPLMVAALLGVLKAGCGYLPLDHHHPEARIDFMIEDAAVRVCTWGQKLSEIHSAGSFQFSILLHADLCAVV